MQIVDLTQPMANGMPVMDGIAPPRFRELAGPGAILRPGIRARPPVRASSLTGRWPVRARGDATGRTAPHTPAAALAPGGPCG